MRSKRLFYYISGLLLLTLLCACNKSGSVVNQQMANPAANSNRSETANANNDATASPQTVNGEGQNQTGVLQGTYTISEVQHDGIVEMISPENSTEITFKQPGSFARQSKVAGTVNHSDSGQYKIEGQTLILKIVMSKNRVQLKPVEKRFVFSLSTDGEELKLTSDNKRTAVFRRSKAAVSSKG